MSIASGARSYADAALDESMATLTAAQQRLATLAGDGRARARNVVADTRSVTSNVVTVGRRQAYAQLGASDAMLAVITKRSADLPGETKMKAQQLAEGTKAGARRTAQLAATTQEKITAGVGEAVGRGTTVARSVRSGPARTSAGIKKQFVTGIDRLEDAYFKLGERGEQVAADLRHDPVVARVIGDADWQVERAANQLTSIAQRVRTRAVRQAERENAAATATPVRPTPARRVPAHRTIVRNTPAGEAAVSTVPVHRAAAYETEIRKAAAAKAAATRQERAREAEAAAQARSEAAAKAAATRKANEEKAAAKRQAAAAKAAQTRKDKAHAREVAALARSEAATKAAATRKHEGKQATATKAAATTTSASSQRTPIGSS